MNDAVIDVEATLERIRAAEGDEAERRRLDRLMAVPVDTSPRPGDPPQPEQQQPPAAPAPTERTAGRVTPDRIIARAASQVGYLEGPDNESKFGEWYGDNHQPWCAMFVSWVFAHEGMPLPATTAKGFEGCPAGVDWFRRRSRWTSKPKRGHVVFYDFSSRIPGSDHVGIVESVNADGSVNTIEGNTGNPRTGQEGVWRRGRRAGIVGYGIPDYGSTTTEGDIVSELPLLKRGQHGDGVRRVQALLRAAYPEMTDEQLSLVGDFGPVTEQLVKRFQKEHRLSVDGEVGPRTWRALLGL